MNIIIARRLQPEKFTVQKIVQCESDPKENFVPLKYFSSNKSLARQFPAFQQGSYT